MNREIGLKVSEIYLQSDREKAVKDCKYLLIHLMDNFSDELPEDVLHSTDVDARDSLGKPYKCQASYFGVVCQLLETILYKRLIVDARVYNSIQQFIIKYTSQYNGVVRYSQQDIFDLNGILYIAYTNL